MSKFITIHAKGTSSSDAEYQDYVINVAKIRYLDPLRFYLEFEDKSFKVLAKEWPALMKKLEVDV